MISVWEGPYDWLWRFPEHQGTMKNAQLYADMHEKVRSWRISGATKEAGEESNAGAKGMRNARAFVPIILNLEQSRSTLIPGSSQPKVTRICRDKGWGKWKPREKQFHDLPIGGTLSFRHWGKIGRRHEHASKVLLIRGTGWWTADERLMPQAAVILTERGSVRRRREETLPTTKRMATRNGAAESRQEARRTARAAAGWPALH